MYTFTKKEKDELIFHSTMGGNAAFFGKLYEITSDSEIIQVIKLNKAVETYNFNENNLKDFDILEYLTIEMGKKITEKYDLDFMD